MNNFFAGLFIGAVAALLSVIALNSVSSSIHAKYNQAIEVCELELPRNQKCKVVGVIDE